MEKFISDIVGLGGKDLQLAMAKATGNFKRVNEGAAKGKDGRNRNQEIFCVYDGTCVCGGVIRVLRSC